MVVSIKTGFYAEMEIDMKKLENKCMLITYSDSMGHNLAEKYYLMFDYMINHISAQSPYYKDFLEKKDASEYHDLFIRYKDFWENGEPTEEQVDAIYKRKPRAPYVEAHFADGTSTVITIQKKRSMRK